LWTLARENDNRSHANFRSNAVFRVNVAHKIFIKQGERLYA